MTVRLVIGLLMTVATIAIAGRRVWWLFRLIRSGQPVSGRLDDVPGRIRAELAEVFGQRRLLRWSIPGVAHFLTFWGFLVLFLTIIEAYGALFVRDFAIPLIGTSPALGFLEDFFAVAVLAGIIAFAVMRRQQAPEKLDRSSRFYGSHNSAAWAVLGMILLVIITLLLYRGAQFNTGHFPFDHSHWAFASWLTGAAIAPLGTGANAVIETVFVLGQIGVIFGFLILVLYSKHLHIALAPVNVVTKRLPNALGPVQPMMSEGKPIDFEEADPEKVPFGIGQVDDFTWKGLLDFATCTECGRCQSQCPAWNTEKPLSPKLLIMNLRDHAFDKAPYILAGGHKNPAGEEQATEAQLAKVDALALAEAERPLIGTAEENGVIDPDVLWSCTTCGACVEQCPVDIEHVDHIVDMRRYQVLIESSFPTEAGVMLRNLENKGNPWGANPSTREDWTKSLDFEIPRVGSDEAADFEYLYWVGCAGAFDDKAKKTAKAVATLLHEADVKFAILGEGETCTGDPARRMGNEFLFQMMAQQNVETLNEAFEGREQPQRRIIASCPHCFNTLGRRIPAGRRRVLGRTPHPTAGRTGVRGPAHAGHPAGRRRHLPRPVLPGPAQPDLRPAARSAGDGGRRRQCRCGPLRRVRTTGTDRCRHGDPGRRCRTDRRRRAHRDAAVRGTFLLLRCRWRPDVDGGTDRQADQRRTGRGGAVHRRQDAGGGLPVLHDDDERRGECHEAGRRGRRERRRGRGRGDRTAPFAR